MQEQDDLRQSEATAEPTPSGLLLSVEPLDETSSQPSYHLGDDSDSDASDSSLSDADANDTADADGTDADTESDADGTDASDADGTDTGLDADGTDPLGIAHGDTGGGTVDADGTDAR